MATKWLRVVTSVQRPAAQQRIKELRGLGPQTNRDLEKRLDDTGKLGKVSQ